MMTMRCLLLACALAVASGLPVLADSVVADVQVVTVGDHAWVIRIRTSEAQGFDVLDPGTPFVVRLHGARLAQAMAAVAPAAFGRVALSEGAGGGGRAGDSGERLVPGAGRPGPERGHRGDPRRARTIRPVDGVAGASPGAGRPRRV